jgi:hypothetical protein
MLALIILQLFGPLRIAAFFLLLNEGGIFAIATDF